MLRHHACHRGQAAPAAVHFGDRDQIYQQLFPPERVEGLYVHPSTFSVAVAYAASAARVDASLVITADGDNVPLRIVDDDRFPELVRSR